MQATAEERQTAGEALAKYEALAGDGAARARFLSAFETNGGKAGALKYLSTFTMTVTHTDLVEVGSTSDYRSVGQILNLHGMGFKDYPNIKEAVEGVEYLVKKNRDQFDWCEETSPPAIDNERPQFSRYWYVHSLGRKDTAEQETKKQLTGVAQLKNVQQLKASLGFMEGMGFENAPSSSLEIQNANYAVLMTAVESLKSSYMNTNK